MALTQEVKLEISAEWSKLNTTLNEASRKINSWAAESGGAFKNFEKSILAFTTRVAAIAAPFAAIGGALAVMAQKTATAGDELLKMGQKVGVPVEKLSALKYAAELSGVGVDELGTYLGHLSKSVIDASAGTGEASDTFKSFGINVKGVNEKIKPTDTLLLELADKFSTMEDSAGKTAIAMALFGRGGKDMIPFLNQGRDRIKEMTDEAEKMGLVFSKDSAEAANKFNDNITKIKEQINALVYAIGNQLIPAFNQLIGSRDGVLKIGYAIGGIFQGAASSALFLSAGIFKIISGLALLTDKLGLTTNQYAKWKEESTLALEASIDLAKKAQGNILDLFIPTPAYASTGDKKTTKKTVAPEIVDTKKREAEIAAFLKKSEDETKRHLERLSAMKEKQADENLELEKKSHNEMWGVVQEYNKKMAEADKAGLIDRTGIYEWFRLQVGEIRKKEMQDEIDEVGKKNSFIAGLQNQILSAQRELYGEEWILVEEYYQKKVEAAKYGAEAELELEKWLVAEMEAVRSKIKPPEPPKKWYGDMKDYTTALSAISSGSLSQMAGLMGGEQGKLIGGVIELVSNIGKLPDLLKASIKGLVEGIRDLGKSIVTIIKDIVVNLPQILVDVVATVISETIPTLLRELPNMILKMISNIWEAIKTLIFGGEIKSAVDDWTAQASTVTVQLDTSSAMSALKQAQEALLGAVNETDRKVAREALLSARSAAILAERQKQQTGSQTSEVKKFEGIFGMIGNIFNNLWKALEDIFGNAWVGLAAVLLTARILQKAWDIAWLGLKKAWDTVWLALVKAWDIAWLELEKAWDTVWLGLKKAWDMEWLGLKKVADLEFITAFTLAGVAIVAAFIAAMVVFKNEMDKKFEDFARSLTGLLGTAGEQGIQSIATAMGGGNHEGPFARRDGAMTIVEIQNYHNELYRAPNYDEAKKIMVRYGFTILDEEGQKRWWEGLKRQAGYHSGGPIKAHSGMYLEKNEVPFIGLIGEGVLNAYNGMKAIGGEVGLNFANRYGSLPGGGGSTQNITQNYNYNFEVVVDKDGNVMKLTRTQAKNLARTLDPVFKEMKRNRELSFV